MATNNWQPGQRGRKPAVIGQPIVDPAGWYPEEFQDNDRFAYWLAQDEIDEIFAAVDRVERSGIALKDVTRDEFVLPHFSRVMQAFEDELLEGRGFVFVRGLPVEGRTIQQNAIAFWGLGMHMGVPVPQNAKGHLLEHVKNAGADIDSATGRGYNSPNALGFHADSCEHFSLMCLRTSKSGGEHRLCSSVTVYNEMLKRRPDLAQELAFRFYRSRRGEVGPDEDPWMRQPVFSVQDGYFAARGASSTIKRAQRLPGVPKLTDAQNEAIALYQAMSGELALKIEFQPGDINYVLNHVALHARSAYEDWPEPERRRHLLRLWLNTNGKRPIHPDIAREMKGIHVDDGVLKTPLEMTPVTA
jgi:hypothetical protein